MIQANLPADPDIHRACCMIASVITEMLSGLLRDAEEGDCRRESYLICREILEELAAYRSK